MVGPGAEKENWRESENKRIWRGEVDCWDCAETESSSKQSISGSTRTLNTIRMLSLAIAGGRASTIF